MMRRTEYEQQAANLQDAVIAEEFKMADDGQEYDDKLVKICSVHARHDIVLMVSYLKSLNRYVYGVNVQLNIVILLLGAILAAMLLR